MNVEEKKKAVAAHEVRMANVLAGKVIYKPRLSIWMILIPVIFVHYFWRLQKFSEGKKQFVRHWLRQPMACLDEAERIVTGDRPTPPQDLVPKDRVPAQAVGPYTAWVQCLVSHYVDLLSADGNDRDELVRRAYGKKSHYLMVLSRLGQCERALNKALLSSMEQNGAQQTIAAMESWCEQLRRQDAQRVFARRAG